MATQYFLINELFLKENSPIPLHVDMKYLKNAIVVSQDLRIRPVLGKQLIDELYTQSTTNTLTSVNKTLLDEYVQPALLWYSIYEADLALGVKTSPAGIINNVGDTFATAEYNAIKDRRKEYLGRAEEYLEILRHYLCENYTLFPTYNNPGTGILDQPDKKETLIGGVLFDRNPNQRNDNTIFIN